MSHPSSFSAEITIPPSSNNAYANVPGRGRVSTAAHKAWKRAAGWELAALKPPKFVCPYRLTIQVPYKLRGDVSNRIKLAEDLLVSLGITPDDRNAVSVTAERSPDVPEGRFIVTVRAAQ